LPCFYVSGDENQSIWNARFLPQETGTYSYHFLVSKNQEHVDSTEITQFPVLPSAGNGILHANSNWTFIYDSGKPFRGIGENVGWEARSWENQKYTYDYFLPKLAQNGVNFFRTWSCNWNLPVEYQLVKDTKFYNSTTEYFNQGGIKRMDELLDLMDSLDMHMMLAFIPHGALITSSEWSKNPYNKINGGPASTPTEFFTLERSKQKFKNTLRYFVARWGYSPGIGVWEFFNEIDNTAYNGGTSLVIPEAAITKWHTEMSEYLSEIDIYNHPITTSISHREIGGLFSVPQIDFNQQHIYGNTASMRGKINYSQSIYKKPHVIGEFGWDWDWNNVTDENGANFDFDLKRGLWYGLFTSTPIVPMTWWWEYFDERNMTPYYSSVTSVSAKMLLAGNGDFKTTTVTAIGFEKYAVQCGSSYFVYLLNNSSNANERNVKLNVDETGTYYVTSLNPSENKYSTIVEMLPSSSLKPKEEIVFIISPDKESIGFASPYSGSPMNLPGTLEMENFDNGMDGSAFHDFDSLNSGGIYRNDLGVDIYEKANGFYIGEIVKGEWLNYSVNFVESGIYSATALVSSNESEKLFRLLMDGIAISDEVEVPQTGSIDNWQSINIPLKINALEKGRRTLTLEFLGSGFSIDHIEFKLENKAPLINLISPDNNTTFTYPTQINFKAEASDEDGEITEVAYYNGAQLLAKLTSSPYNLPWESNYGSYRVYAIAKDNSGLTTSSDTLYGEVFNLHTIPGTIEAEDYDIGNNGKDYFDLSEGNKFKNYRTDDIDIEVCSDEGGGFSLGDFQTGEWLNYKVKVEEAGNYLVDFRVATQMNGCRISLSIDGVLVASSIPVTNTGGWQSWTTVSIDNIQLSEGEHVITLGSVSQFVNVNNLVFSIATSVPVANTGGWQTWTTVSVNDIQLSEGEHVITLGSVSQYVNINNLVFSIATSAGNVNETNINCYPNPVNSVLYFSGFPPDVNQIKIYNNIGQPVIIESAKQHKTDVTSLSPGFYNIIIVSKKEEVLSRMRFVKF